MHSSPNWSTDEENNWLTSCSQSAVRTPQSLLRNSVQSVAMFAISLLALANAQSQDTVTPIDVPNTTSHASVDNSSQWITVVNPRVTTAIEDQQRHQWIVANQSAVQLFTSDDIQEVTKNKNWGPQQSISDVFPQITALALSPDGTRLLVAGGAPAEQGGVKSYDWKEKKLLGEYQTDANGDPITDVITDVQWSGDGKHWIEAHWSGKVLVRDQSGNCVCEFAGHTGPVLTAIFWSNDIAISAGVDQSIKVWSTAKVITEGSDRLIRSLDNHTAPIHRIVRYESDNSAPRLISCSQDQTIRLWDPQIGRMIRFVRLKSRPGPIAFPTKNSLWIATDDGVASQWTLPLLEQQNTWKLDATFPRAILVDPATQNPTVMCARP